VIGYHDHHLALFLLLVFLSSEKAVLANDSAQSTVAVAVVGVGEYVQGAPWKGTWNSIRLQS